MENKYIEEWNKLTDEITKQFLLDYFEDSEPDYWWVADEIGGIFYYADFYLNFSYVLTCYKLGITKEQLINWYNYCLENESVKISLAKYIISPQERKEQDDVYLKNSKERVDFAEKEFKKAMEEITNNFKNKDYPFPIIKD